MKKTGNYKELIGTYTQPFFETFKSMLQTDMEKINENRKNVEPLANTVYALYSLIDTYMERSKLNEEHMELASQTDVGFVVMEDLFENEVLLRTAVSMLAEIQENHDMKDILLPNTSYRNAESMMFLKNDPIIPKGMYLNFAVSESEETVTSMLVHTDEEMNLSLLVDAALCQVDNMDQIIEHGFSMHILNDAEVAEFKQSMVNKPTFWHVSELVA